MDLVVVEIRGGVPVYRPVEPVKVIEKPEHTATCPDCGALCAWVSSTSPPMVWTYQCTPCKKTWRG